MVGYNAHEYRPEGGLALRMPKTSTQYEALVASVYGDLASEFLRIYPHAQGADALLDATGDIIFGWSGERITQSHRELDVPS